jgi:ribose 5-phosphate isomerase B
MNIALGSDHAGVELKTRLLRLLDERHISYKDFGPSSDQPVDYPDFALRVATTVASGAADRGILVCGTGMGMAIAANKVSGIRAVPVTTPEAARLARAHNDANVLTLGGRVLTADEATTIVDTFLTTPFERGRHQRRLDKITAIEMDQGDTP